MQKWSPRSRQLRMTVRPGGVWGHCWPLMLSRDCLCFGFMNKNKLYIVGMAYSWCGWNLLVYWCVPICFMICIIAICLIWVHSVALSIVLCYISRLFKLCIYIAVWLRFKIMERYPTQMYLFKRSGTIK